MDIYIKSYVSYAKDILVQCNIPKNKMNLILSAFQDTLYDYADTQFLKYIENEFTGWNTFKLTDEEYEAIVNACR